MEVENHIPIPFGRDRFLYIMDWIRKHQKPGWNMEFMNTKIFILSPTVAYSVSLRKETIDGEDSISRVTLIYLKKDGIWKIIHGHFSYVPE
jgi:ketosteroid isomerase-like protein